MHKKKKNTVIILAIILLLIILLWQIKLQDNSSGLDYDFAVTDTASITKIFIADLKGGSITLDREKQNWKVNNKYNVKNSAMNIILKTIKNISVQRPVAESSYNNVVKELATNGVKIEIYQKHNKKPCKTYTIGNNTANHSGTYMLLENSNQPYIMHIIGFNGIMGPRYGLQGQIVDINAWRDKNIFKLNTKDILSFTLINERGNDSSFTIENNNGNLLLFNLKEEKIEANQKSLEAYLNYYQNINCENYKNKIKLEDLRQSKKLYSLTINHKKGTDSLIIYQMREKGALRKKEENYTVDRMYATLNNGDVMLIQNYVFNKLLITIDELKDE